MTVQQILRNKDILRHIAPLDLELLLSCVLKKPREYLFTHPRKKLAKNQIAKFNSLAKRRVKGEPVAYILGRKEFCGLEFIVNRNVLIPRPETELLVDLAIKKILNTKYRILDTIIDIGTGSGNIIISIVKNIPAKIRKKMNFLATDISPKAIEIAKKNARKHKVDKRIKFIRSNLLEFALQRKLRGNIMIVANLPYVSRNLYQKYKSNLKYEPEKALISPKRGTGCYIRLVRDIIKIRESGKLDRTLAFFEISPEQKKEIFKITKQALPAAKIQFFKDLSGKMRIVEIDK